MAANLGKSALADVHQEGLDQVSLNIAAVLQGYEWN